MEDEEVVQLRTRNKLLETTITRLMAMIEAGISPPPQVLKEMREAVEAPIPRTPLWQQSYPRPNIEAAGEIRQVIIDPDAIPEPDNPKEKPCCH